MFTLYVFNFVIYKAITKIYWKRETFNTCLATKWGSVALGAVMLLNVIVSQIRHRYDGSFHSWSKKKTPLLSSFSVVKHYPFLVVWWKKSPGATLQGLASFGWELCNIYNTNTETEQRGSQQALLGVPAMYLILQSAFPGRNAPFPVCRPLSVQNSFFSSFMCKYIHTSTYPAAQHVAVRPPHLQKNCPFRKVCSHLDKH